MCKRCPLLALLLLSFVACGPAESHPCGSSSSSSGDSNPSTMCDGPGEGDGGEPCASQCDCCSLDCRVLTMADGGMSGVCAGNCLPQAGTDKPDAGAVIP